MHVNDYCVTISDNELGKQIELIYRGNENIIIREEYYSTRKGKTLQRSINVPRSVMENFIRLINE